MSVRTPTISSVRIIGAGLIGTSIALALRQHGVRIEILDKEVKAQELACDLVQSETLKDPAVIVIATPVSTIFELIKEQYHRNPDSIIMDIGSTKTNLQRNVETLSELSRNFVGTHPMAGREVSGPTGARSDLFEGRAWPIIKSVYTSQRAFETAREVIELCGATAYEMTAEEHDETVAAISHVPQLVSTLMASELSQLSDEKLNLAGQGLRDVTRLAGSDPTMWVDILRSNQKFVTHVLQSLQRQMEEVLTLLDSDNSEALRKKFVEGNQQQKRISGKHGARARNYSFVNVVVGDKPGQLGALFIECAKIGVNVEDVTLEHSPGQETGLITLALSQDDAQLLHQHLVNKNWQAHRA